MKGFKKYVSNAHLKGVKFAFYRGKNNISLDEFDMSAAATEYKMVPVIQGAKRGGTLQLVIGAVALVAAFFTAGTTLAAWGNCGISNCSRHCDSANGCRNCIVRCWHEHDAWGRCANVDATARFNVGSSSSTDNKANYAFGTPVNTVAMGYPVPLLYGERKLVGPSFQRGSSLRTKFNILSFNVTHIILSCMPHDDI